MKPTREQALEWAREAGVQTRPLGGIWCGPETLEKLVRLVHAEGQRDMRERAAKTCDDMDHNGVMVAEECATEIRNLEIEE